MASVPLFAPDGSVRQVPPDQLAIALNNGGKRAVRMTDPNGTLRYVPEDQLSTAQQAGGKIYQDAPTLLSDPKAYLQNQAQSMGQDAQRQWDLAQGVESQGKSLLSRMGHALYSTVPATGELAAKVASGLVGTDANTWKNAAILSAGALDPAIPGAYYATQGTAQLTGMAPGVRAGDTSPENVQNALLAASSVAGGASAVNAPNAGATLKAGPPLVRGAARVGNAVLSKAPEYVLGGTGAALGNYVAGGTGAAIGGTAGAILGKVLPDVRIPGENFGLAKSVPAQDIATQQAQALDNIPTPQTIPAAQSGEALARIVTRNKQAQALETIPARPALPSSMTGEALGQIAVSKPKPPVSAPDAPQAPDLSQAQPSTPVPVGNLPLPKTNPYSGPRTPAVMEPVVSGQINKIGYHPESQTAVIQFSNGRVYDYRGVPKEIYQKMKDAESVGSFFAQNIKGRYPTNFRGAATPLKGSAKAQAALLSQSSALAQPQTPPEPPAADATQLLQRYVGLE